MTSKISARRSLALMLGLAALSVQVSAYAKWVTTASRAYSLQNATATGTLSEAQPLHVVVALKLQDESALDDFIQRSHTPGDRNYGATLTGSEFVSRFAPSLNQTQAVTAYLQRGGFTNIKVSANRLLVTADAAPSRIESAFNTRLQGFHYNGHNVHINIADAQVPEALGGVVLSVLGLQNADRAQVALAYPDASGSATGHFPVDFATIYDALGTASGSTTTIGIISDGNLQQTADDLASFIASNHLSSPQIHYVPSEQTSTDTSGIDEWDLDSQTSLGMAQSLSAVYFYNAASLDDADLTVAYNNAVSDNVVQAVNVSLGECEWEPYITGSMAADDVIFKQAVAQGQTFFVATGDGGANTGCFFQEGLFRQVSYPASSPYVVAVGGTTLETSGADGTNYVSETAWQESGGGTSAYESAPSWQKTVTGSSYRQVPDVAMDANPNSGAVVVIQGWDYEVGGTSLATPLSTGTWARVEAAHGNSLGFAAPFIYAAAADKSAGAFHDITSGSNAVGLLGLFGLGGYTAKAGYDEVTGWGTFDVTKFSNAVN
jgi:pseudomonalisin/xanthomonalisin